MKIFPLFDPAAEAATPPAGATPAATPATPPAATPPAAPPKNELSDAVRTVFGANATPEQREAATRKILKEQVGYSDSQIEAYMQSISGEPEPAPAEPKAPAEKPGIAAAELTSMQEELRDTRRVVLENQLQTATAAAFGSHTKLKDTITTITNLKGAEKAGKVVDTLKAEVWNRTIERLQHRKDQANGRLDTKWVGEETARAAEEIADKYAGIFADIAPIGRVNGLTPTDDAFLKSPPKKAPDYQKGMTLGSSQAAIGEYTRDALSRLALSTPTSGDTFA
jgi:hypothetical protein